MTRREGLAWCAAACVPIVVGLARYGGPGMSEDSYQYLSTAENLTAGEGVATSILHFDVDRTFGRVPAPMTMWPPGYPAAIAAIRATGVPLEAAATLISLLSFAGLVPLALIAARLSGVTSAGLRVFFVLLFTNSWAFVYPSAVTTESLFTLLTTAAAVCLLAAACERPSSARFVLAAGVLIGLSYWIRYAGLVVLGAATLYVASLAIARRKRAEAWRVAMLIGPAGALIGAIALRNHLLTGSWKAGYGTDMTRDVAQLLKLSVSSAQDLLFGAAAAAQFGVAEAVMVAGGLLGFVVLIRTRPLAPLPVPLARCLALCASLLAAYVAGLVSIAAISMIGFDSRMFYPMLPLALFAAAAGVTWATQACEGQPWRRRTLAAAIAAVCLASAAINLRSILIDRGPQPHQTIARWFEGPLVAWMGAHMPSDAVIVATAGQATGHVLRRPTVSLAPREFSDTEWTEETVRQLMRRFNARFLIVYPGARAADTPEQAESAFLSALVGGAVPPWLSVAAESPDVRILARR